MAVIELKNVRKAFGAVEVIGRVNLTIPDGAFVIFVGPSGGGKSTLLRVVAGLEDASAGQILIDGAEEDLRELVPARAGKPRSTTLNTH